MDPARKRRIRLIVSLTAALLLATALVYTSFNASSEAKTPSQLLQNAESGRSYQLTGKVVPVGRNRGPFRFADRPGFLTVHPSSLLREPDPAAREAAFRAYCDDFRRIRDLAVA